MEPCLIHLLFAQNISLHLLHSKNSGQILVLKSRWSRGAAACIVETLQRSTDPTWRSAISKETDLFPLLVFFNRVMVMPSFGGPGTEHTLLLLVCVCVCVRVCVCVCMLYHQNTHTLYKHTLTAMTDESRTGTLLQAKIRGRRSSKSPPHTRNTTHTDTHTDTHTTQKSKHKHVNIL